MALALAFAVGALAIYRHGRSPPPRGSESSDSSPTQKIDTTAAKSNDRAPRPDLPPQLADLRGQASSAAESWDAMRRVTQYRANLAHFGEPIADLLDQPASIAFPQLKERATKGDVAAAATLMEISNRCSIATIRSISEERAASAEENLLRGLDAKQADFARAVMRAERDRQRAEQDDCDRGAVKLDWTDDLLLIWSARDDLFGKLLNAFASGDESRVREVMRERAEASGNSEDRLDYIDALLDSDVASDHHEAIAALIELAPESAEARVRLGACLARSPPTCADGFPIDAQAAFDWIEQAAELGDPSSVHYVSDQAASVADRVGEAAWLLYEIRLASRGCVVGINIYWLVAVETQANTVMSGLSDSERSAAEARASYLETRYAPAAEQYARCGP